MQPTEVWDRDYFYQRLGEWAFYAKPRHGGLRAVGSTFCVDPDGDLASNWGRGGSGSTAVRAGGLKIPASLFDIVQRL